MGRYYWDKKDTVEESRSVSISFLRKHDYLSENSCRSSGISWKNCYGEETSSIGVAVSVTKNEKYARFYYTVTDHGSGEKTEYDYRVQLTTTPCNFGGVRYWFICPISRNGIYCGRRVGKLYKTPSGKYFGCRHCCNLSYQSRNEPRFARAGGMFYPLELEGRMEKLGDQINRWTYKGRPTRKARRIYALKQRIKAYDRIW